VDTNGSILSKSEIRYTSNFDSLSDKFKVVSTFSSGEVLVFSVNVNVLRKESSAHITADSAKQTNHVGKATKLDLAQRLQQRYKHAVAFFQERMQSVDKIISIAKSKGLTDTAFLNLIEKKYPMVRPT
jgi:hypothetical protein